MKKRLTYQNGLKRSLGLVVLLMMSMLMLPTIAMAEDFSEDGLYYSALTDNTVQVVKPTSGSYSGTITIPETVIHNGTKYWVTAIGERAFQGASGVTSVTLPLTTITSIGAFAFNDCTGLTEFTLPASIASIGQRAFYFCDNLKHLYVHSANPASYHSGSEAFSKIHYGSHVCTLHVPTGCTAAYAADGSPFKSFTQVEEFDAPQVYDLWVAGTRVTSFNATDILGDGVANYDASTKTLTIGGDITVTDIDAIYGAGIYSEISNLTIYVSAPSTITAPETVLLFAFATTITGSSLLTITSTTEDSSAINAIKDLTIKNAHLDLTGAMKANNYSTWNIQSSIVTVNGTVGLWDAVSLCGSTLNIKSSMVSINGQLWGWDDVTLEGCYFEKPGKGVYNTYYQELRDEDDHLARKVVIKPGATPIYYDLFVGGTMVNSYNASDILGDGAASYDASTKTLIISGDITNSSGYGILSHIENLTVQVSKPSTITGNYGGIGFTYSATITGGPLLTIKTLEKGFAIDCGKDLTIKNANLIAMNDLNEFHSSGSLTIISSSVDVSSNLYGAIYNWSDLILDGCFIETPKDCVYNTSTKNLEDKNGNTIMTASITPCYDLSVGGKRVTYKNASDILGKGIASYDASTNTLTIGGNISAYGTDVEGHGISSDIEDLTVLVSAPTIIAATEAGMYFTKNATITGSSSLTITCSDDNAIVATNADLTIKDAQMNLTGQLRNLTHGILNIQSSAIDVIASAASAISNWDVLTLKDCRIETPEEGVYDNIDRRVEDKTGVGAKSVKIGATKLANDLAFSKTSATATIGQSFTEPTLTNPHNLTVTYSSSKPEVAKVNKKTGKVTLVSAGAATITASFAGNETYKAGDVSYTLTVNKKDAEDNGLKLSATEATIEKGKSLTLKATVTPSDLPDKSVTWKSSNTKVATVTSAGKVKGVKAGTATITCTSNSTGAKATCKVTVGYVKLDQSEVSVKKGKTVTLKATVYPSTLEDKSVTWKSSNKKVATVTSKGKVKGVKAGTATITCTSNATGLKTTCKVTVGYVKLDQSEVSVKKGKTVTLKATVYPSTLEDKSVTWESSNTKVATVTSKGKVKGVKAGTATITCTSNATGLKATCKVTVGYVELDQSEVTVKKGKTVTLTATVYPSTLEDKSVTWESSNTKVATVSSKGKVKGVKAGTVTITCTSNATGLSTTCIVTVKATAGARSLEEDDDDELTEIDEVESSAVIKPFDVYDLSGHKVLHQVTSLDGLSEGIYIVNGKKILKK